MAPVKNFKRSRHLPDGSVAYQGRRTAGHAGLVHANAKTQFLFVVFVAAAIFLVMMFSLLNENTDDEILVIQDPVQNNLPDMKALTQMQTILPRSLYTSVETLHSGRINRLKKVCQENAQDLKMMYSWRYKFDQRHNMLYCPIPKSGWSSWKRVLFYINGVIKSMDVEIGITSDRKARVSDMSGLAILKTNKTGRFRPFTFAFVRNPWERLVSAYINKALDWNYTRILHTPCEWESMKPYRPPISFVQFLQCISDHARAKKKLDMHWTPMWMLCDFCQINYNAVGHMETVSADAQYVIERLALNIEFPRIFSSRSHNTSDVLHSWYAAVPADVIQELRKLYKYDFLFHGYSDIPPGWENRLN